MFPLFTFSVMREGKEGKKKVQSFDDIVTFFQPTWITQCPLLLLDTRMPYGSLSVDCEEHLDLAGTGSFFNEGEADIVVQHVLYLIYAGGFSYPCSYLMVLSYILAGIW